MHKSHQEEHSKQRRIKSYTFTKLFDRSMNRRIDLWNDKEITITLTALVLQELLWEERYGTKYLGKPVSRNL